MMTFIKTLMEVLEELSEDFEKDFKPLIEAKIYLDTIFMLMENYDNRPKLLTYNKMEHNRAWQ